MTHLCNPIQRNLTLTRGEDKKEYVTNTFILGKSIFPPFAQKRQLSIFAPASDPQSINVMTSISTMDSQIATIQTDRLSINAVSARRSRAPKLSGGLAAHTSSSMYKGPVHGKPKAKRWDHRLTDESKARKPSSLKGIARYISRPGMISLGGGLPSSRYFPIEHLETKVPSVPHFSEEETQALGVINRAGKRDISEGKAIYDLDVALNYGQATGSAQMLRFVTEHTEIVHQPPYDDWACTTSIGTTNAFELACRMLVNRGDYVLTESYTFSSAVETLRPLGANLIGIDMDAEGLLPAHIDSILTDWDPTNRDGKPKPFFLYTVPSGQNPTGATQSLKRRKDIYRVAQKHDLYIIEDEPYYFLQMQPYTAANDSPVPRPSSHEEYIRNLVPSLLSLDVDGRVMRLDSFSKVIAPGMRMGWITASEQMVERFIRHSEVSVQNASGPSQIILFKLLDETWGHSGYLDWLIYLRLQYTNRRDNIVRACETYLPREVATWDPPMAGMFHWIKIDHSRHPEHGSKAVSEIEEEIFQAALEQTILISKGSWFRADESTPLDEIFFRATFAAASDEQIQEGIKRFGIALKDVFELQNEVTNGVTNGVLNGVTNGKI